MLGLAGAAPGDKTVVFETRFAIGKGRSGEGFDAAAGGFEDRLPRGGVPLHRRSKARVEVGLAGRDQSELKRTAAFPALQHRIVFEKLADAPAVFMRTAVDNDKSLWWRGARLHRFDRSTAALPRCRSRSIGGVNH